MSNLPTFDNHDDCIVYYELLLEGALDGTPFYPLPAGYRFVFYQPGDRDAWIAIEQSARELISHDQGVEVWNRYYANHEAELPGRMLFIETESGEKVATVTAFYDITGRDQSGDAWLHWVAVRREYQGRSLAKPLISRALERMREMGYTRAKIPTQTTTWLACRIYLDFGFRPIPLNAVHSRDGWRIIKRLTNHPALAAFDAASDDEVLKDNA